MIEEVFMDAKQKSLLVLTVAALGFLGYQVFQLVNKDITETPVIAEQQASASVQDGDNSNGLAMTTHAPASIVPSQNVHATVSAAVEAATSSPTIQNTPTSQSLTQGQHAYVKMLNQYELTKMHHQLLDEEAAVANAQHQIAQLNKSTAQLTGSSAMPVGFSDDQGSSFSLSYIDQQNGVWSATIHDGSEYQSVNIGSRLSNGFQVIGIDHQGVILAKGSVRELLSFNGIDMLPASPSATAPNNTSQLTATLAAAHGVGGEQAKLLAMQLTQDGSTSSTVARQGLQSSPVLPALAKASPTPLPLVRSQPKVPYQISTHDVYAQESEDDMQQQELSKDLHLPSLEIKPVVNEAYNVSSYLPQQVSVPQSYHLDQETSAADDENQFASESADTDMPAMPKIDSSVKKILKLPQDYYTIQLIGSYHQDVVSQFVLDNQLKNIAVQLSVGSQTHPWTIALYGVYPNFETAEQKLVNLPARLRLDGAWVRKVGDVQNVLKHQS